MVRNSNLLLMLSKWHTLFHCMKADWINCSPVLSLYFLTTPRHIYVYVSCWCLCVCVCVGDALCACVALWVYCHKGTRTPHSPLVGGWCILLWLQNTQRAAVWFSGAKPSPPPTKAVIALIKALTSMRGTEVALLYVSPLHLTWAP